MITIHTKSRTVLRLEPSQYRELWIKVDAVHAKLRGSVRM